MRISLPYDFGENNHHFRKRFGRLYFDRLHKSLLGQGSMGSWEWFSFALSFMVHPQSNGISYSITDNILYNQIYKIIVPCFFRTVMDKRS